ncbi:diacylglycerol kinase family protein [Patescibacteria group bacterium]|nr:diacylglycerol kinase family protein [Patescibacteria group bacterium]
MLREHQPANHLRKLAFVRDGFLYNFRESPGFRLHLLANVLSLVLGWRFRISRSEWLALTLVASLEASAEMISTAIEDLADAHSQEDNDQVKHVKDSAAAGVFASVLGFFATCGIIFIPRLLRIRGGE